MGGVASCTPLAAFSVSKASSLLLPDELLACEAFVVCSGGPLLTAAPVPRSCLCSWWVALILLLSESVREVAAGQFAFAESACCCEEGSDAILTAADDAELW